MGMAVGNSPCRFAMDTHNAILFAPSIAVAHSLYTRVSIARQPSPNAWAIVCIANIGRQPAVLQSWGIICVSHRRAMKRHCVEMSNTFTHAQVRNLTDHMGPFRAEFMSSV